MLREQRGDIERLGRAGSPLLKRKGKMVELATEDAKRRAKGQTRPASHLQGREGAS